MKDYLEIFTDHLERIKKLKHENVVGLADVQLSEKGEIELVLETPFGLSMKKGLADFQCFEEPIVKKYTYHILKGLKYLHDNEILHGNLKCSNILMSGAGEIKLSDFGVQKELLDSIHPSHAEEIPNWLAPEVIQNNDYCKASDVWSLGCCILEMLTGKPPWSELNYEPNLLLQTIKNTKQPPQYPPGLTNECVDFLNYCFASSYEDRVSVDLLINHHPFVVNTNRKN